MLGSLIGGALGVGSAIFGGVSASKAAKRAKRNVEQQLRENQDWYDRRYNEDATQRADAQRVMTLMEERIRDRNRQAAGTQAVMGGTPQSVAAEKAANAKALSDAASSIAATGEARKDKIESQYLRTKDDLNEQLRGIETGKAANVTSATAGVADAAAGLGSAIDEYWPDLLKKKPSTTSAT